MLWAVVCLGAPLWGQYKSLNPEIVKITEEVDAKKIEAILKRLEAFGTRHVLSSQDDPERGIGAARKWIFKEFQSYSPRLEVRFDSYKVKKQDRIAREMDLYNVVAVLKGKVRPDEQILITGHYDSLVINRRPGAQSGQGGGFAPGEAPAAPPDIDYQKQDAPGVTDDGSGTAVVMELARVMSRHTFDKTLVFVAFAGEEVGLVGSTLYAANAKKNGDKIEAVLNNDIVGSELSGNGRIDNGRVNVFSDEPSDSESRAVARYIEEAGNRYVPGFKVDLIFRADRLGRGGDHTPFHHEGFGAVRLSTPAENYAHQHTVTDAFANTSVPYIVRVARVNAAASASLALAPMAPAVTEILERNGRKLPPSLMLTRGKSRYDAQVRFQQTPEEDLLGYAIVMRSTLAPRWEREVFVGKAKDVTLPDVSIDEWTFGVKAIDKDGNESLVTSFVPTPRPRRVIQTESPTGTSQ
ncbi:MAG: M20/M25/M40 family metallo-hydrolase [Bryobacteraceae bacterium]